MSIDQVVFTFGQHEIPEHDPFNNDPKVLDVLELERRADGTYSIQIDATEYTHTLKDQWYSTAAGVLEFYDAEAFLSINAREQAEEVARRIAFEANKEVKTHYIQTPDRTPAEVVVEEYEATYGSQPPAFDVKITGTVEVVDPEVLVEYWEEQRDED